MLYKTCVSDESIKNIWYEHSSGRPPGRERWTRAELGLDSTFVQHWCCIHTGLMDRETFFPLGRELETKDFRVTRACQSVFGQCRSANWKIQSPIHCPIHTWDLERSNWRLRSKLVAQTCNSTKLLLAHFLNLDMREQSRLFFFAARWVRRNPIQNTLRNRVLAVAN